MVCAQHMLLDNSSWFLYIEIDGRYSKYYTLINSKSASQE